MTSPTTRDASPSLSVVIASRDRVELLRRVLEDVDAQTTPPHEVIVVDDGSTDGTAEFLESLNPGITAVRLAGVGVSAARNAGTSAATGEFVVFLDDDDRPRQRWIEGLTALIDDAAGLVSCGVKFHGAHDSTVVPRLAAAVVEPVLLAGAFGARRSALLELGGFMDGLTYSENTELGWRLLPYFQERGLEVRVTDEVLVDVHVGEDRRSTKGRADATMMVIEAHERDLERNPVQMARWLCVAGVEFWREGRHRQSRRVFRRALRTRPGDPKIWLRVTASYITPIGRHLWG